MLKRLCNQKIRFSLIFGLAIILSLLFALQTAHAGITLWGLRGELWGKATSAEKTIYVQGLMDGLIFAGNKVQGESIIESTSVEHLIKGLDAFYADFKNALIPVPFALKVISLELQGREKPEIEKQVGALRKQFAEPKKTDPKQAPSP